MRHARKRHLHECSQGGGRAAPDRGVLRGQRDEVPCGRFRWGAVPSGRPRDRVLRWAGVGGEDHGPVAEQGDERGQVPARVVLDAARRAHVRRGAARVLQRGRAARGAAGHEPGHERRGHDPAPLHGAVPRPVPRAVSRPVVGPQEEAERRVPLHPHVLPVQGRGHRPRQAALPRRQHPEARDEEGQHVAQQVRTVQSGARQREALR